MKAGDSRYCRCLYFSSNSLARKLEKLARDSWKPVGLSPSHGYLLMIVIENQGIQPGHLAQQLLLTPSTITRLVEKLEAAKLITRKSEGKRSTIFPTELAQQMLPKLKQSLKDFSGGYLNKLGKEESFRLAELMNRIHDEL